MATRRGTQRRKSSVAMDAVILDAAVGVVLESGPDDLNLSAVARTAGVTTGAVYSRYENRQELLLDVWDKRASDALRQLIFLAAQASRGDTRAATQAAALLAARDPGPLAGIALMIAAPRIEELDEALIPQVRSWFDPSSDSGAWDALVVVAFLLGALAFDAASGSPQRDWGRPLLWASTQALPAPTPRGSTDIDQDDQLLELLNFKTGDEVRDQLLESMALVVAKSGLKRATTSRIARSAGYQQSAVFDLWPTRAQLVAEFVGIALQGMVRSTSPLGAPALAGDAAAATEALTRVLGPAYQRFRRLRLETVLAAMADGVVAALIAQSDAAALTAMLGPQPDPAALGLAEAVRAVTLGCILLEETVGGIESLDFTGPVAALLGVAARP